LPDTEFEAMVREMPEAHREVKTNYRAQDTGGPEDVNFKTESPESGDSESTESAIGKVCQNSFLTKLNESLNIFYYVR